MKRSQAARLIDELREMAARTDRSYTATELGDWLAQHGIAPLEVCTGEAHSNPFIDNCLRSPLGVRGEGDQGHMKHIFELHDIVKRSDVRPDSIPAYRDMRGKVVAVSENGWIRVCWGPGDTDELFRNPDTVVLAGDKP